MQIPQVVSFSSHFNFLNLDLKQERQCESLGLLTHAQGELGACCGQAEDEGRYLCCHTCTCIK